MTSTSTPNGVIDPNPYGPINNDLLLHVQQRIGKSLPEDYISYLKKNNGGTFEKDNFIFEQESDGGRVDKMYGLHFGPKFLRLQDRYMIESTYDLAGLPSELDDFFVFAGTATGDPLMINLRNGSVYCYLLDSLAVETDRSISFPLKRVAGSFREFVQKLMNLEEFKGKVLSDKEREEFEIRLREFKKMREEGN